MLDLHNFDIPEQKDVQKIVIQMINKARARAAAEIAAALSDIN